MNSLFHYISLRCVYVLTCAFLFIRNIDFFFYSSSDFLTNKTHYPEKLAVLAARENEHEARVDALSQEKEDLALKLGLTEKILKVEEL